MNILTAEEAREIVNSSIKEGKTFYTKVVKAIKFLNYCSRKESGFSTAWVCIHSDGWYKKLGKTYPSVLEWCITNGLILRDDTYNPSLERVGVAHSKSYKLAKVVVGFSTNSNRQPGSPNVLPRLVCTPVSFQNEDHPHKRLIIRHLKNLKIDTKSLKKLAYSHMENIQIEEVTEQRFNLNETRVFYSEYSRPFLGNAQEVVREKKKEGMSVICTKGQKFMIGKYDELLETKRKDVYGYSLDCLEAIELKKFYSFRNKTNNRLDTNITNMPSYLLEQIMRDNGLTQIDLKNSQFAILASILPDNDEFVMFKHLAATGELYNFVEKNSRENLDISGKLAMFALMFGKVDSKSKAAEIIKPSFPKLVDWVNNRKKELGCYKKFSVELQKIESKIFIDEISNLILNRGIFCLSKHDSIIVKNKDIDYAIKTISRRLKKNGIAGTLRVESFDGEACQKSEVHVW